jgi:hypothetical protein
MKGWSALFHRTSHQLMDELERVSPNSMVLALARSVFANGASAGVRPSGRPTTDREQARRAKWAQREADDREGARLYRSGLSMLQVARAMGKGPSWVSAALRRQGVQPRPKGPTLRYRADWDRVERIRAARANSRTLREIGAAEHISRERVRQICVAHGIAKADRQAGALQ